MITIRVVDVILETHGDGRKSGCMAEAGTEQKAGKVAAIKAHRMI